MLVEEMQRYYGRRAPLYDASMGYDSGQTVEGLVPVIDLLKSLMQDRRVLEIGCGPCFWTGFVSESATSILATDFNESTLDQSLPYRPRDHNHFLRVYRPSPDFAVR